MHEGFYTAPQAAAMLGVTRDSVWRWCRSGKLPGARLKYGARKMGWLIPAASVVKLMEVTTYVEVQDDVPA